MDSSLESQVELTEKIKFKNTAKVLNMDDDSKKEITPAATVSGPSESPKGIADNMNQQQLDDMALNNLIPDKTEVTNRLEKIIDRITEPVLSACEQVKGRSQGTPYEKADLLKLNELVMKQLTDLEKDITERF